MLRTILVVLAGYIVTAIIVMVFFFAVLGLEGIDAEKTPPANLLVISLFVSFVAAIMGGLTTACLAKKDPFRHAVYLIVFGLAMGLIGMAMQDGREPFWYQLAVQVILVVGVMIGGQWIVIRQEKKHKHH